MNIIIIQIVYILVLVGKVEYFCKIGRINSTNFIDIF